MQTPYNSLTDNYNQNENLIKNQQQNNQQNIDVNQFFVESNTNTENNKYVITFLFYRILVPSLVVIFLIGSFVPITIPEIDLYISLISMILGVILSLLLLIFSINKIEIIKDESNNKIIIKVINFLFFSKKIIKIDRENFHFLFKREVSYDTEGGSSESIKFYIINDFKNLVDIDLDVSSIKKKPAKFYYTYDNVRNIRVAVNQYTIDLNNFLGISSNNYENPLYFDINKYMNKNTNERIFFFGAPLSKYMKFSDHFFTFHFKHPSNCSCFDIGFFISFLLSNFCTISLVFIFLTDPKESFKYLGIIIFVIWNIIFYIIYKLSKKFFDNIYRIDCIFSRNFDRIFIGIVKYTKTSYVDTFELQMNNIDKFILEKISIENFNLIVIFKNGEKHLICNIKKNQEDLEGLAYLLNERLIKNADDINVVTNKEEN